MRSRNSSRLLRLRSLSSSCGSLLPDRSLLLSVTFVLLTFLLLIARPLHASSSFLSTSHQCGVYYKALPGIYKTRTAVFCQPENMFKSWSKKNKIKAVFKLKFRATQVPRMKKSAVMIALVPDDIGKPTVKLEKVAIQDGTFIVSCRDLQNLAFLEKHRLTWLILLQKLSHSLFLYPCCRTFRNDEDSGDGSLKHQLSNCSTDEVSHSVHEDGNLTFEASDGVNPVVNSWQDSSKLLPPVRQNSMPSQGTIVAITTNTHMCRRSNTDWSTGSASDGSIGDWTNSLEDNLPREKLQEPSDNATENLKSEIATLKRQVEVSEAELQSLQKLLEKECSRGQSMARQIFTLREERNMIRTKYEQLMSQQNLNNETKTSKSLKSEMEDARLQLEATKEELVCEKELTANLQLQLQKTQNSNSELLLAVRELEAMLEQKKKEILDNTKEHDDATQLDLLKHKIANQNGEMDIYYKQSEELNKHIKELTLEYELLKKENLDVYLRLKQGEAQQIMLQRKYSASLATIEQLQSQVWRLEEEIKKQGDEFSESLICINELENQVSNLERELKLQAEKFEEDLHTMKCAKIEQEEQAIQAEEALKKTRHNNALKFERLQDEYRRLSVEMTLNVEENKKMTIKAYAEADELQKQNKLTEEMLQQCNQELRHITNQNELKLQELSNQIDSKEKTIAMMSHELEIKSKHLEDLKRHRDEKDEAVSKQIQLLRIEIKKLMIEEQALSKAKPIEHMTKMLMQESKDKMTLGTLLSEVEIFKIQHNELKRNLHKEQAEKENMKKKISQLEGKLKKKEAEQSVMENKLKNNKGQATAIFKNLVSRDDECTAPCSSTMEHTKKPKSETHQVIVQPLCLES